MQGRIEIEPIAHGAEISSYAGPNVIRLKVTREYAERLAARLLIAAHADVVDLPVAAPMHTGIRL
jgi:hypothetical protein